MKTMKYNFHPVGDQVCYIRASINTSESQSILLIKCCLHEQLSFLCTSLHANFAIVLFFITIIILPFFLLLFIGLKPNILNYNHSPHVSLYKIVFMRAIICYCTTTILIHIYIKPILSASLVCIQVAPGPPHRDKQNTNDLKQYSATVLQPSLFNEATSETNLKVKLDQTLFSFQFYLLYIFLPSLSLYPYTQKLRISTNTFK